MWLKKWRLSLVSLLFVFVYSSFGICTGKNKELFIQNYKRALQEQDEKKMLDYLEKARQFCDVSFVNAYYFLQKAISLLEKYKKTNDISSIYKIREYIYKAKIECQYINNQDVFKNICPKISVLERNIPKISQYSFITENTDDNVIKNTIAPKDKGVKITGVYALIKFRFNSFELTPEGEKLIKKIVSAITEISRGISVVPTTDIYKVEKITLIGYADTTGKASYNKWLSTKRAQRVAEEFIKKYGFDKDMIEYWGEGESFPICSKGEIIYDKNGETRCSIEEDKAKSRRVEIILHWK